MQQQDDSVHTVNAAAVVLAAAARSATGLTLHHHHHHHHLTDGTQQKRRWWSRLKAKLLCFRPHGHPRRIADASPSPQPAGDTAAYMIHHETQPVFAFVAPPSSPASSLLASEATSPVLLRLTASSTYSSPSADPRSMFAVGPYAREPQQLVSPPVPSTFTTEPSTPPLTPPQECASLRPPTNPSSPEVPFARFLASSSSSSSSHAHAAEQQCGGEGFQAYCLQPGSPILVSPGSVCSTSSSPPLFRVTEQPPVILRPEDIAARKLHRLRARTEGSLLDGHIPAAAPGTSTSTSTSRSGGRWSRADAVHLEANTGSEVAKSGEFVFGNRNADGGAPASVASEWFAVEGGGRRASMEAGAEGGSTSTWPFYPMHGHGHS